MLEWHWLTGFDWDAGNARKNTEKHGVGQAESEQGFFNSPLIIVEDVGQSRVEARYHTLGKSDEGRRLHITFTLRGARSLIRVISARDMHRKERRIYEQGSQAHS